MSEPKNRERELEAAVDEKQRRRKQGEAGPRRRSGVQTVTNPAFTQPDRETIYVARVSFRSSERRTEAICDARSATFDYVFFHNGYKDSLSPACSTGLSP